MAHIGLTVLEFVHFQLSVKPYSSSITRVLRSLQNATWILAISSPDVLPHHKKRTVLESASRSIYVDLSTSSSLCPFTAMVG